MQSFLFSLALASLAACACPAHPGPVGAPDLPAPPPHVVEVWRAEAAGPLVPTPAGLVLAERGAGLVALDASGAVRPLADGVHALGGLVARDAEHLVLLDATSLTPRWRIPCPPGGCAVRASVAGSRVIVAGNLIAPGLETGVLGLDAATGRVLWRRPLPFDLLLLQMVADESQALLVSREGVVALDVATGQARWRRTLDKGDFVLSHGARIRQSKTVAAYVDPFVALHVVDAGDGEDRWTLPFADEVVDMALDGSALYVVARDRLAQTERLLGLELASGAVRYDRPLAAHAATPAIAIEGRVGWIRMARDEVAARNDRADAVLAVDLATGAPIGDRDLGENRFVGVARDADGHGVLLADVPGDRVVALGLAARAEPLREADVVVHVRVPDPLRPGATMPPLGGLRVRVGAATTVTAGDGTVHVRARGVGVARVELLDFRVFAAVLECPSPDPAFVDFGSGRASFDVDVHVRPRHCR